MFCGNVRISAGDMTLLISTPIRYHEPGARLPDKHQLLVRFEDVLSKKTAGQPCPECGSGIRKEQFLGGAVYYCPTCQEL